MSAAHVLKYLFEEALRTDESDLSEFDHAFHQSQEGVDLNAAENWMTAALMAAYLVQHGAQRN